MKKGGSYGFPFFMRTGVVQCRRLSILGNIYGANTLRLFLLKAYD
ncbi:hypothetical protein RG47T_0097 [Mucilaginibacter polytrichastri]|uniref:Uncharacterized protein n=1 Tax=Mucilaginibacter polytrichastri TaxID=1302689 RepID=A0A1Q5ZSC2_9SPHI|nr:hypothetical protein RG47T_0097 [Mucilaginibacter polytrichastri]